jgi:hypothetical protein
MAVLKEQRKKQETNGIIREGHMATKTLTASLVTKICILILLNSQSSVLFAAESCHEPDFLFPETTLILKNSYEDKSGNFFGIFELGNYEITSSIAIPGEYEGHDFYVSPPYATIEFKDLNGTWTRLSYRPPEEYLPSPNHLKVRTRSKAIFRTMLFPKSVVELSGSDFRLVIKVANPSLCIVSFPFRAYPVRKSVKGFKTISVPKIRSR